MTKEEILKLIESRVDTMQKLTIECIEMIYNAGYNSAIDDAVKVAEKWGYYEGTQIRAIKKQ